MEKLLEQILEEKYKKSIKEASNEEIYFDKRENARC